MKDRIQLTWLKFGREGRVADLGDWALQVYPPGTVPGQTRWRWLVRPIDDDAPKSWSEGEADSRVDAKLDAEAALWHRLAEPTRVVIEVDQGRVVRIHADQPLGVVVVDRDQPSVCDWSAATRDLAAFLDRERPVRDAAGNLEGRWPWALSEGEIERLPEWLGQAGVSDAGLANVSPAASREGS